MCFYTGGPFSWPHREMKGHPSEFKHQPTHQPTNPTNQPTQRNHPPLGRPRRASNLTFIFIFVRSVPKTQSAHEWDLELVSGAEFWCNLHCCSSRGRSRGSRGPPWAPRGRKSAKNPGPDLLSYPPQGLPRPTHACGPASIWAAVPMCCRLVKFLLYATQ